ncbi:MAG TPA: CARDB domain-containing protein [Rhodothermales bacterium]|nr:CARDB domain-containing protein [Rhodothermales bacterium]
MRKGLLANLSSTQPTANHPTVEVFNGADAGRYFLYDVDGDSIWSIRVPQPAGETIEYAFAFDVNGNGYDDLLGGDWIYELNGAAGARSTTLTDAPSHTLPLVAFDDRALLPADPGFTYRITHRFPAGNPGSRRFGANPDADVFIDLDRLEQSASVAVRWYTRSPGGDPPEGIVTRSENSYWIIDIAPLAADYEGDVEFSYGPIPGIGEEADLRLLHRVDASAPWSIVSADVDVNDREIRLTGTTDVTGEWTLGSVSAANPLSTDPPIAATNPRPSDGVLAAPIQPLFQWKGGARAETYDIYLWPGGETEPGQPLRRGLAETQYQHTDDLTFGESYNWRIVSINLNGQTAGPIWSFRVGEVVDLTVNSVELPETGFSGQEIEVRWTVENQGDGGTNAPVWYDGVFLSEFEAFDANEAVFLAQFKNVSFLNPSESYANTQTVKLPDGIEGPRYVHVFADAPARNVARGRIDEDRLDEISETNNSASATLEVTLTPFADLRVTGVIVPANVFSGDSIDVRWTVENAGNGRTSSDTWFDAIFLSNDDSFDFTFISTQGVVRVDERLIATVEHRGALEAGQSYTSTSRIKLPDETIGTSSLFVYADRAGATENARGNVYEFNVELNNWAGDSFESTLTPPPDLIVTEVQGPPVTQSGELIDVSWTVLNQGPGATRVSSWVDIVYFSPTAEFDSATAVVLGSFSHSGALAVDASYQGSGQVWIPDGLQGEAYLFVAADGKGSVFEHTFASNNLGGSSGASVITRAPYPDLQIPLVTAVPAQVTAGQEVALTYTVENRGTAAAGGRWTDSVYVLTSPDWDHGLAAAVRAVEQDQGLEAGASRRQTVALRIPVDVEGTLYIYVKADAADRIFEYPDAESNEGRSQAISVTGYPPVDLTASFDAVPEGASSGQPLALALTIANDGNGKTLVDQWIDHVYLSSNDTLDGSDPLIARLLHEGALDPGTSYTIDQVTLPPDRSGDQTLFVYTDADDTVDETDDLNNLASTQITITLTEPADLRVTAVEAPDAVQGGQPAVVHWTVTNEGVGPARSSADNAGWFDAVFLSPDGRLDRNDVLLGTREHAGALAAGASYSDTMRVTVPAFASGPYVFLVQTDRRDDVYEHLAEGNNLASSETELTLPAPSDLVVSAITAPAQAVPGEEVVVAWTITNKGDNPARGFMREAVFVSSDDVWDIDDPILGVTEREIDLAPGAQMEAVTKVDVGHTYLLDETAEVTEVLPGLPPGTYRAIVRTNIANTIRETITANNTSASEATMNVDVPVLTPGVAETVTLAAGQAQYYRLEAAADQDIRLSLTTDTPDASNELYAAFERAPVPGSNIDVAAADPFTANQTLVLSSTEAGTYFLQVLARAVPGGGATETVTVLAEVLGFEITGVSHQVVGQGQVTLTLAGGGLRATDRVLLRDGTVEFEAEIVGEASSTGVVARFLLENAALGTHDVVVAREEGDEEIALADAVTVESAAPLTVEITDLVPDAFRDGGTSQLVFDFTNVGNTDIPYLEAQIQTIATPDVAVRSSPGFRTPKDFASEPDSVSDFVETDGLFLIPLFARDVPPGAVLEARISTKTGSPGRIEYSRWAEPSERSEFVDQLVADALDLRSFILSNSNKADPEAVARAGDVGAFVRHQLERAAETQLIDPADIELADLALLLGKTGLAAGQSNTVPFATQSSDRLTGRNSSSLEGLILGDDDDFPLPPAPSDSAACAQGGRPVAVRLSCSGTHRACDCFKSIPQPCLLPGGTEGEDQDLVEEWCVELPKKCKKFAKRLRRTDSNTPQSPSGCGCRPRIIPCDPNDIIGPKGYGDQNWVGVTRSLLYTIRFENDPEQATAPAQVVEITHPLDSDVDARSFRLGDFGFGPFTFSPPENAGHYRTRLDVTDSLGLFVDVTAGIDILAREAFWVFSSVSPETGAQPRDDPFAGFLPINNESGDGEGFVNYTIRPRENARTGDEIEAVASIVFDMNAPIETPAVLNTIDADLPTSRIRPLPWKRDSVAFSIEWEGSDTGSGLSSCDVYVSRDDGPFELFADGLIEKTFVFAGEENVQYRYFSRATDNAGNREALKSGADTGVLVPVEETEGELPAEFALYQNYPNPFNPSTNIEYDLPAAVPVHLTVYNMLGQRVAVLLDEEQAAGRYRVVWNADQFASGVYFYRIRAGEFSKTAKMMLVK